VATPQSQHERKRMFKAVFLQRVRRLRGVGRAGIRLPKSAKYLLPVQHMETRLVAQPASYSVGTVGSPPRVKMQGRKTEHLSPPNAHVKNERSFRSTSPTWRAQKQLKVYLL